MNWVQHVDEPIVLGTRFSVQSEQKAKLRFMNSNARNALPLLQSLRVATAPKWFLSSPRLEQTFSLSLLCLGASGGAGHL